MVTGLCFVCCSYGAARSPGEGKHAVLTRHRGRAHCGQLGMDTNLQRSTLGVCGTAQGESPLTRVRCGRAVWAAGHGRYGGHQPAQARGRPGGRRGGDAGVRVAPHAAGHRQRRHLLLGPRRQRPAGPQRAARPVRPALPTDWEALLRRSRCSLCDQHCSGLRGSTGRMCRVQQL